MPANIFPNPYCTRNRKKPNFWVVSGSNSQKNNEEKNSSWILKLNLG